LQANFSKLVDREGREGCEEAAALLERLCEVLRGQVGGLRPAETS
jgi:hypothetical protein